MKTFRVFHGALGFLYFLLILYHLQYRKRVNVHKTYDW